MYFLLYKNFKRLFSLLSLNKNSNISSASTYILCEIGKLLYKRK